MPNSRPEIESQIGTQRRSLRDFTLLLSSRIVAIVAGVAFVAISARLFPPAGIAFLAWITILSSTAETIRGFGITNVLTRQLPLLAEDLEGSSRWIGTHFLYASVPLLVLPLVVAPFIPFLWTMATLGAALQLVVNNQIYVFQAMGKFRVVSVGTILSTLLQRIAPLALAWYGRLALRDFIILQAILSLPVCLALIWHLRKYLLPLSIVPWSECWPQARAFYAAGIVRYGATQADQLLVALLFPSAALAPYFLIRRLYSAVVVVLSAGVDVLIPRLGRQAAHGIEQVRAVQAQVLKQAAALCAIGGCLVAANAGALIPIVVGSSYKAPPLVIPALMIAALAYGLFSFALAGEVIAAPPKETFRIAVVAAVLPLISAPLLIPLFGIAAFPIGMTLGYVSAAWCAFARHPGLKVSAWLAHGSIAAVGLLAAAQEGWGLRGVTAGHAPIVLNLTAIGIAVAIVRRAGLWNWSVSQ